jgi:outer membrane murein-binding lipoprotein Lpp
VSTALTFCSDLSLSPPSFRSLRNQKFTVNGTLLTQGTLSTAVVSKSVYLEGSYDGQNWFRISTNATTKAGGAYSFSGYISLAGTYYLRVHFDGTTAYAGCVSNAKTVKVG